MADQIFIQHRFSDDINVNGQTIHFEDAIVLPIDEYNKLAPKDIEAQKLERVTNFKNIIEHPIMPIVLSKEEQLAQTDKDLASIEKQKAVLTAQRVEVAKIEVAPIEEIIKEGK